MKSSQRETKKVSKVTPKAKAKKSSLDKKAEKVQEGFVD
jgi:hypothetical protein